MDRYDIYTKDDARILYESDNEYGDWVKYEDAAARIAELEAQLAAAQERISIMQGLIGETIVDIPSSTSTSYPAPSKADHA